MPDPRRGSARGIANCDDNVIVTISREYGAAGLVVADGVAHALGYALLTDDLQKTVAARLGTSVDEVAQRATSDMSLGERMLGDLGVATAEALTPVPPPLPGAFDDSVRREIERTVRERAEGGNIVILGRGASSILAGRTDLVRVFLHGAKPWRVGRLMEAFTWSREEATREAERVDAARKKFARERYNYAWGDPHQYDLTLDVSRLGIETCVQLIALAVREKSAV